MDKKAQLKRTTTLEATKKKRRNTAFAHQIIPLQEADQVAESQPQAAEESPNSSEEEKETQPIQTVEQNTVTRKDRVMPSKDDRRKPGQEMKKTKTLLETLQEEEQRIRQMEATKPVEQFKDDDDEDDFKQNKNKHLAEEGIYKIAFHIS